MSPKVVTLKYIVQAIAPCRSTRGNIHVLAVKKNGVESVQQPQYRSDEEIMADRMRQALRRSMPFIQVGSPEEEESKQAAIQFEFTAEEYAALGRPTFGDAFELKIRRMKKTEAV